MRKAEFKSRVTNTIMPYSLVCYNSDLISILICDHTAHYEHRKQCNISSPLQEITASPARSLHLSASLHICFNISAYFNEKF